MSVTHVAGPVVNINGRIIQRCVVCGDKLFDNLRMMVMLKEDGTPPNALTFPERHVVTVDGGRKTVGGDFADDNVLIPADFCLESVEEY